MEESDMAEKMTLEQVRDWATKTTTSSGWQAKECDEVVAALNALIAQPAQAVDVGAIREVIAGLLTNADDLNRIDVCPMLATHLRNAADTLTRAIGNAQASN
jgi:hypothetical protein